MYCSVLCSAPAGQGRGCAFPPSMSPAGLWALHQPLSGPPDLEALLISIVLVLHAMYEAFSLSAVQTTLLPTFLFSTLLDSSTSNKRIKNDLKKDAYQFEKTHSLVDLVCHSTCIRFLSVLGQRSPRQPLCPSKPVVWTHLNASVEVCVVVMLR